MAEINMNIMHGVYSVQVPTVSALPLMCQIKVNSRTEQKIANLMFF